MLVEGDNAQSLTVEELDLVEVAHERLALGDLRGLDDGGAPQGARADAPRAEAVEALVVVLHEVEGLDVLGVEDHGGSDATNVRDLGAATTHGLRQVHDVGPGRVGLLLHAGGLQDALGLLGAGAVEDLVLDDRVQVVADRGVHVGGERRGVGEQLVGDLVTVCEGVRLAVGDGGRHVRRRLERVGVLRVLLDDGGVVRHGSDLHVLEVAGHLAVPDDVEESQGPAVDHVNHRVADRGDVRGRGSEHLTVGLTGDQELLEVTDLHAGKGQVGALTEAGGVGLGPLAVGGGAHVALTEGAGLHAGLLARLIGVVIRDVAGE